MQAIMTWLHGKGFRPLEAPVPLPAARVIRRVTLFPKVYVCLTMFIFE